VIGEIVSDPVFQITHQGLRVCDLPVSAITTDVRANRESQERPIVRLSNVAYSDSPTPAELQDMAMAVLEDMNSVSKRYVYRFYDNAVRGDTVIYPGEADAVLVTPIPGSPAAVAVSMDSNVYGNDDPYLAGAAAVAESVRNVVAVGARPIALTDCLNYGNPEKPAQCV
jgi:phosphoribosylformylglycinamidine synthase